MSIIGMTVHFVFEVEGELYSGKITLPWYRETGNQGIIERAVAIVQEGHPHISSFVVGRTQPAIYRENRVVIPYKDLVIVKHEQC